MNNIEVVEYIKVLTGIDVVPRSFRDLYSNFLNSDVSIKDFYIKALRNGIDNRFINTYLYHIFNNINDDKDLEIALRTVSEVIENYKIYLETSKEQKEFMKHLGNKLCGRRYNKIEFLNLKLLPKFSEITLDGVRYDIRRFGIDFGFNCMQFHSSNDRIENIVGVLFANKEHKILCARTRKEYNKAQEEIDNSNYDFLMIT